MASSGASASCRKKIFSPGMASMPNGSQPREKMWKVSRQTPRGVVGHPHDPPGVQVVVHVPAPGEGLVGDPDAVIGRPLGERAQVGGGELVVAIASGETLEQTSRVSRPQPLHHPELVLGPAKSTERRDGLEVPERLVQVDDSPRSAARRRTSSGESMQASRSFSKSSTPSNPAAAIAASFSGRVPLTDTVAMHLRSGFSSGSVQGGDELGQVGEHAAGVGLAAGEQAEGVRRLEDHHAAAVEGAAAERRACRSSASPAAGRRCRRPTGRGAAARRGAAGRGGGPCRSGEALTRPSAVASRPGRSSGAAACARPSPNRPASRAASSFARSGRVSTTVSRPAPRVSSAWPTAAPAPPAPSCTMRRTGASGRPRVKDSAKPVQSVLWPMARSPSKTTVFTAPSAGASSDSSSRCGMTACLHGWVMLNPS